MEQSNESLARKIDLYKLLYELDSSDDNDDRHIESKSELQNVRKRKSQEQLDGDHGKSRKILQVPVESSVVRVKQVETKNRANTKPVQQQTSVRSQTVAPKSSGLAAGPPKLFSGLHFFFFPNNTKHPGRRFRIEKAKEHGATWETDLSNNVTHMVVDSSMTFDQVLKVLRIDVLPPHIHVVNQEWPGHCIDYGTILDSCQPEHRVPGHVDSTSALTKAKYDSLPLKPAKRDVQTHEPHTPSQDARSTASPELLPAALDVPTSSGSKGWESPTQNAVADTDADALSNAIRDAKDLITDEDGEIIDVPNWQRKFQCMHSHTSKAGAATGPNGHTIDVLQQMADYYDQIRDKWRTTAYRKAIATLRQQSVKINTAEEALKLPNIGERLAAKIEEIVYTGHLRRLEDARAEPTDHTLQLFLKVYGVGYNKAMKFISQGHRTLDDLRHHAVLEDNQKIGLAHYDEFNSRIPRPEVRQHHEYVAAHAHRLDPALEVHVMGSYRRGAPSSGDVDLLLTHPSWPLPTLRSTLISRLLPRLQRAGYIQCTLAATSQADGTKWHGAARLPTARAPTWRRVDFLLVPAAEMGAALIYFTGNDLFCRSVRLLAGRKGMRLNQRGLYRDVMRGEGRRKVTEGVLVEGRCEREIFRVLGVPWRPPEERVI